MWEHRHSALWFVANHFFFCKVLRIAHVALARDWAIGLALHRRYTLLQHAFHSVPQARAKGCQRVTQ